MANHVHVVGTGTIGAPLAYLLAKHRKDLGLDRVTVYKHTPRDTDIPLMQGLVKAGAELVTAKSSLEAFRTQGFDPVMEGEEALASAAVIVEATPDDVALDNKAKYEAMKGPKGFLAQGSESGFGTPFALGVNDDVLSSEEGRFVQIVSCNTHAISSLIRAMSITPDVPLEQGRFVCIRRITDVSQASKGNPAPEISKHKGEFGTHHAEDVVRLYKTTGRTLKLRSSAIKVPTQYMHTVWFDLTMDRDVTRDEVTDWITNDHYLATTTKNTTNAVFNTGRELGPFGRILNQCVVPTNALHVSGRDITGFAFTPQDGNVILSNAAAVLRFTHPDDWRKRMGKLDGYLFKTV